MSTYKNKLLTIASALSARDVNALKSIYDFRCLNGEQIYKLHYYKSLRNNKINNDDYSKKKIRLFLSLNLIEEVAYKNDKVCYFLTNTGVQFIKHYFDFKSNIYSDDGRLLSSGHLRSSELKMSLKNIPHQIALNDFVIKFILSESTYNYTYTDSRHSIGLEGIIPDGILTISDTIFFIEMDLATENVRLLENKWKNYINYLSSQDFINAERRVKVLFVTENADNPTNRIRTVKNTIYNTILDLTNDDFNIYVGESDDLISLINEICSTINSINNEQIKIRNLQKNFKMQLASTENLSQEILDFCRFKYLAKFKSDDKNYFFFIDFFNPYQVHTLKKISDFEYIRNLFYNAYKEDIKLLILTTSIKKLSTELYHSSTYSENMVVFDENSLVQNNLFKSLRFLDDSGNIYIIDSNLKKTIESNIFE